MARIEDRKKDPNKAKSSGSYTRIFGNQELGDLISAVHATSIANGSELERIINEMLDQSGKAVKDVDTFLEESKQRRTCGIFVFPKSSLKKSKTMHCPKHQPDFVILRISDTEKTCHIIELKDGYMFDTKKADGEKVTLKEFSQQIAQHVEFSTRIYLCAFYCEDKGEIMEGSKGAFLEKEILTGREFCALLGLNYEDVIHIRHPKEYQQENLRFFVDELLKIEKVKELIKTAKENNGTNL